MNFFGQGWSAAGALRGSGMRGEAADGSVFGLVRRFVSWLVRCCGDDEVGESAEDDLFAALADDADALILRGMGRSWRSRP
ncbi:hypothetical protein [Glycomyces sp. YM15]|uniref:hypothetical protein n=1 Tax=Glycomyces sp. YM15 TaxID=2800446 RepID=UPI001962C837|nr:hypothetical protein [Glycomyces sp. YM15]